MTILKGERMMLTLYTAPFCPKCELAIQKLREAVYEFEIKRDPEEALNIGIKVAPCLLTESGLRYGLKEIISVCKGEGRFE
jgi:hypothetical protein